VADYVYATAGVELKRHFFSPKELNVKWLPWEMGNGYGELGKYLNVCKGVAITKRIFRLHGVSGMRLKGGILIFG